MKVTFETASFADSVKNAALVAPGHGAAFDKANGLFFDMSEEDCTLRSTNLDIFRMEWLTPESVDGEPETWRLPAKLFAQVLGTLPIGSGKTVTIESKIERNVRFIRLTSDRIKVRFGMIDPFGYPDWRVFDPDLLKQSTDIGARIAQVEWAADSSGEPPWAGVHLDGKVLVATDRYRMASVPLPLDLDEPVTLPSGLLSTVLKQTGEIRFGVHEGQFLLMPDEAIQIRCILYGQDYPPTDRIRAATYTDQITVRKPRLLELLNRAASFSSSDRDSLIRCFIGQEEFAVFSQNLEVGTFGDALSLPGQANHDRFEVRFTPKNIVDLLSHAPSEEVILHYELGKPERLVMIDGGSGYFAWGMPRKQSTPESKG